MVRDVLPIVSMNISGLVLLKTLDFRFCRSFSLEFVIFLVADLYRFNLEDFVFDCEGF